MDIPERTYQALADEISSDASPVGIDAKKTHIMILYQLRAIEDRLKRIEDSLRSTP
jgi:hypothetical protein